MRARVVVLPLVLSATLPAAGCDFLLGLLGGGACATPEDFETDPNCEDPERGHITGRVNVPEAGAASTSARPALPAGFRAIRAAVAQAASDPRAVPGGFPTRKHRVPAQGALPNLPTTKVPVEEFRAGEVIVRGEDPIRGAKQAWSRKLTDFLADGTTVQVGLCNTAHMCLARLTGPDGKPLDLAATAEAAARLDGMPALRWAERNLVLKMQKVPNDEFYALQWHYGAIDLEAAWDVTTGDPDVVAAVVDTGILSSHPDLAARVTLTADLIDDPDVANDGDGRDDDGEDAGDEACGAGCHSYHGSHVAGTMGAATNNGSLVSGVAWDGEIISARVLGKGGGSLFDIVGGLFWAIGSDPEGVARNPRPADVVNMSLGGPSEGSDAMNEAVEDAVAFGTIVIVAAGNDDADASGYTPANAPGAIPVASVGNVGGSRTRHQKASYSNYGSIVSVAGPGGEQAEDVDGDGQADGVLSTIDDYVAFYQGTSMAAPHVAGVAMLMKSVDIELQPADARRILEETADREIDCDEGCGAGLVNAARAVREVAGSGAVPYVVASPAVTRIGRGDLDARITFKNIGASPTSVTFSVGGANREVLTLSTTSAELGALQQIVVDVTIDRTGEDVGEATVTATWPEGSSEARLVWTPDVVRVSDSVSVGAVRIEKNAEGVTTSFTIERIVTASSVDQYRFKLFNLRPGTYIVLGLTDDDADGEYETHEGVGMFRTFPDPEDLDVQASETLSDADFAVVPRFGEGEQPGGGGTGAGDVGDACAGSFDCQGGLYCETVLPNGYCTTDCTRAEDCPTGSSCFCLGGDGATCDYQICLATCTTDADCRDDGTYSCDVDGTCYP